MINISQLVDNQLPEFFVQEYPLFVEFFKQYYKYTEIDNSSSSILKKIQSYQSADFYKDGIILETTLGASVSASDTEITLSADSVDNNLVPIWKRFPNEGLVLLRSSTGDEIVQYKEIDNGVLKQLRRGSAGTVKLGDLLVDSTSYKTTEATSHDIDDTEVINITHLFLASLFKNLKTQYFSGLPVERLNQDVSVPTVLKYVKDFYTSKGTSPAVEFLFRSSFNDDKVLVRYPNEQLIKASTSTWSVDTIIQADLVRFSNGITVDDLPGLVIKQKSYAYDKSIQEASASIERIVPIKSGARSLYRIYVNAESIIGEFKAINQTVSRTTFNVSSKTLVVDSTVGFPRLNGVFYVEGVLDANGDAVPFTYTERSGTEFYGVESDAISFVPAPKNRRVYSGNTLYVVEDFFSDPDTYSYASFRPTGLVSDFEIKDSGLLLSEGDTFEFAKSGIIPDMALTSSWVQNIPGPNGSVALVTVNGAMNDTYLAGNYSVTKGVNGVYETEDSVYVSSNGFPFVSGSIGNINGGPNSLLKPASQRHLKKIPKTTSFAESLYRLPDNNTVAISVDGVPIISPTGTDTSLSNRELVIQGEVTSIDVISQGSGYSAPPRVQISGVGGASASAVVSNGRVVSIDVINPGQGYRSSPNITISTGSGAIVTANFGSNNKLGQIQSLNIENGGSFYTQTPDIKIVDESGRGRGAKFIVDGIDPVNGNITSIKKVSAGYDYDQSRTKVYVIPTGTGATAQANVRQWHRDNYASYTQFSDDANGYPFQGRIPEYNDAYHYVGNPRGLRITKSDNITPSGVELTANLTHSPIVAWSYDGVPIYGPVGFSDPLNPSSQLKRLESSYFLRANRGVNGPTSVEFTLGSFVEDYEYKPEGDPDHKDLDQYNGRFCVTPEFPEGRYCYFLTIHSSSDPNQRNRQDAQPRYPYVIGPNYKYNPETINFTTSSILENLPLDVIRVRDVNDNLPNFGSNLNATVTSTSPGSVNKVVIENRGENYTIEANNYVPRFVAGDGLLVDDTNTQGIGFSAKVSSIIPKNNSGNTIDISSISFSDIQTNIDTRKQKLVVEGPNYNQGIFEYNRIFVGDVIRDTTKATYTIKTAIPTSESDTVISFRGSNVSNISIGDTAKIQNEVIYFNSAFTNSTRYAFLSVASVYSTVPVAPFTDQGFYYRYVGGKDVFDEIYIDIADDSVAVGKILEIDYEENVLKVEMYIDPNTQTYYAIPALASAISNAPQSEPRYSQNISSVEYIKNCTVVRGYDGSKQSKHPAGVEVTTQAPTGVITEYLTKLYITGVDISLFTPGVYVLGQTSDTTAKIVSVETLTATSGYLYVDEIKEGPNASDIPRFGTYNNGAFDPETIVEIGAGVTTNLKENVSATDTVLKVVNSDFFMINRYLTIGSEIMRITDKKPGLLYVTRAQGGTTADPHQANSAVYISNTSGTFDSDEYDITVDLTNPQRFTNTSEFLDNNSSSISVISVTDEPLSILSERVIMRPSNLNKFSIGDIIRIGDEKMRIDSKNTNIFNVTRGFEGTEIVEHNQNSVIENVSKYDAIATTNISHDLLDSDLIEITGDPSSDEVFQTGISVRVVNSNFQFSSVHTDSNYQTNPSITLVYGHTYVFDVSDATNANTTLGFYSDRNYTNEISVERVGVPGNVGATITIKHTDRVISNIYYNNPNSIIQGITSNLSFIEDPYNVSNSSIYDLSSTTFKYIVRNKPEGNARGVKVLGLQSHRYSGKIQTINITNTGTGYQSLPEIKGVYFRKEDAFDADFVVDDDGSIVRIDINFGGTRYISPTAYIVGSGSGAEVRLDVQGGTVRQVSVLSPGFGYDSNTKLLLVEEDPRTVRLLPQSTTIGKVNSYRITNPGYDLTSNYTMAPEVRVPTTIQVTRVVGQYRTGEFVYQGDSLVPSAKGLVINYDARTQILKLGSVIGTFNYSDTIYGYTSTATSTPNQINSPNITAVISSVTEIAGAFSDELGKLNTASQKIQDSYFYQDFSYVIRSQIPVSDWRETIKTSTHPAGFLVFGEVIIDSSQSVAMLPVLGNVTCPSTPHISEYRFDSRTEINSDGYLYLRNALYVNVGDVIKYDNTNQDQVITWSAVTESEEVITGRLVHNRLYYVLDVVSDQYGTWVQLGHYHPKDKFADVDHNKENYPLKLIPTDVSYKHRFVCDKQNPTTLITVEIIKEFNSIRDTTASLDSTLKTIQINKFFQFSKKRGIGSLIVAEGSVAVDLKQVDNLSPSFVAGTKIYDLKSLGTNFVPYNENALIITLDGVVQEPGKAYSIINERKLQELEITTTGAGELEFDSWYLTNTSTNAGTADIHTVYNDVDFVYIKTDGVPSYTTAYSGYDNAVSAQSFVKRFPKVPFAPNTKDVKPYGTYASLVNGVQLYNTLSGATYNNQGYWSVNDGNYSGNEDVYNGVVDPAGTYYHYSNPIELRRQLGDNITASGAYIEAPTTHSPILGWAYDGTPIYGPYGYSDATNNLSSVVRIESAYQKRSIITRNVLPDGTILEDAVVGPPVDSVEFTVFDFQQFNGSTDTFEVDQNLVQVVSGTDETIVQGVNGSIVSYNPITRKLLVKDVNGTFAEGAWIKTQTGWAQINSDPIIYNLGYFAEDYVYVSGGQLDQYNGRFCVTPEFPEGRYCYFTTIESTTFNYSTGNNGAYPYFVGPEMYHRFYEENSYRTDELRDKIIFNDPPVKYTDPISGREQVQQFQGRLFSFVDPLNNQQYAKKFKDISSEFDSNKTTFNLEFLNNQPLYSPTDPAEVNEYAFVCMDGIPQVYGRGYTINPDQNTITFTAPPKRVGKVINMSEVPNVSGFLDSEIVVGQTSGARAKIIARTPVGYEGKGVLKVEVLSSDFVDGENIHGETSNITSAIKLSGTIVTGNDRFLDAANLIEANKQLIAEEAVDIMLDYPAYRNSFNIPGGNQNCIDDVIDVIGAVVNNLRFGGNNYAWDAANLYATGGVLNHLVGEEEQSKLVFRWAKDLCILAMQNRLGYSNVDGAGYPTNAVEDRFIDAANLIASNKNFIANEAVERMLLDPNNAGFNIPNGSVNCIDDVKDVIDAIVFNMKNGGNNKVWDSANFYATTTNLQDEETESIEVFNHARDICNQVIFNDTVLIQGSHGLTQTIDNTITVDPGGCANVQSAITSFIAIITGTINDSNFLSTVTRTSPKAYPLMYNNIPVVTDGSIIVDGGSYTASCANVESAIYTLFDIVINTIDNPSSLSSINRTTGKSYIEKVGVPQKFFAFSNGKYTVLDPFDTSSQDQTTFLLKRANELIVPTSSLQIIVMVNGVIQEFGVSYVLNEALLEFYEPVKKDSEVVVLYWYGKDLEKILQGYNMPLYEPNFVKRDLITGTPYYYVDSGGFATNKLIRSIQSESVPISTYLTIQDKIQIDGEASPRTIFSVSDRDIIQWETDDTESNTYYFDATNINTLFRKVYLDSYTGTSQTSDFIEPGTLVTYDNGGNPDIPGLTGGQQYYVGYRYPERAVLFFNDYQTSLSSDETYAIAIGTSTGNHSITIPSDLYGLKQANITTSDYGGITRGTGADLTARVRWDMEVASTIAYVPEALLFSAGETVAKVVEVKSATVVEIQMLPDRQIPVSAVVTTDLGGSNPQTVISRSNGRVVAIDPVQGSFPIGADYETAPAIVIRAARNDTGRFARAYSQIDRNNQLANCVVTSVGEEYYEVPDVLVSREYNVISPTYPTVMTAGYLNFWTSKDTQISVSSYLDTSREFEVTVLKNIDVSLDEHKGGQEVTVIIESDGIVDDFKNDQSIVYQYNGYAPYERDTSTVPAVIESVGVIRMTPTFSLLEQDRFLRETSFEIGNLEQFSDLTIGTVSDRHFSSIYKDENGNTIRYNQSPITSTIEAVATLDLNYQAIDSTMHISSVAGFNRLYVEGTTFWLRPGYEIYNEVSTDLLGRVERIIDSNTWVIQLERGKQIYPGQGLTYAKNTVKVTEVGDRYGFVQFAEPGKVETVKYGTINWTQNRLEGVETSNYSHSQGVEVRTAYGHE